MADIANTGTAGSAGPPGSGNGASGGLGGLGGKAGAVVNTIDISNTISATCGARGDGSDAGNAAALATTTTQSSSGNLAITEAAGGAGGGGASGGSSNGLSDPVCSGDYVTAIGKAINMQGAATAIAVAAGADANGITANEQRYDECNISIQSAPSVKPSWLARPLSAVCRSKRLLRAVCIGLVIMVGGALPSIASTLPAGEAAPHAVQVRTIIRQAVSPQLQNWRKMLLAKHNSLPGCYTAHYPDPGWTSIPCVTTRRVNFMPPVLTAPKGTMVLRPATTGNGNDYMAQSSAGTVSATGTIQEIDNFAAESDSGLGPGHYTLQINSAGFPPPAKICASCTGAVQFIYDQNGAGIFVQYWMLNYITNKITACPTSWTQSGSSSCFKNGYACSGSTATIASAPSIPITDLPQVVFTAQAIAGGNDTVTMFYGQTSVQQSACDNILDLRGNWFDTEFNILGDLDSDVASFNTGVLMTVGISLLDLKADSTNCTTVASSSPSQTVESTNMNLGSCTAQSAGISFIEGVPPVIGSLNPNYGSQDGGKQLQIMGSTAPSGSGFSSNMRAQFGATFISAICAGNQCTVASPQHGTGAVPVGIENLTSTGAPGVLSTQTVPFSYQVAGSFMKNCPPGENAVPPNYTLTTEQTSDFYSWSGTPISPITPPPADMTFLSTGMTSTGPASDEHVYIAACPPNTKTFCASYDLFSAFCYTHQPPTSPPVLKNCLVCRENNQQCVKVPGGYHCSGNAF